MTSGDTDRGRGMGAGARRSVARARAQLALVSDDRPVCQWRALVPVEAVVSGQLVDLGPSTGAQPGTSTRSLGSGSQQ